CPRIFSPLLGAYEAASHSDPIPIEPNFQFFFWSRLHSVKTVALLQRRVPIRSNLLIFQPQAGRLERIPSSCHAQRWLGGIPFQNPVFPCREAIEDPEAK